MSHIFKDAREGRNTIPQWSGKELMKHGWMVLRIGIQKERELVEVMEKLEEGRPLLFRGVFCIE